MNKELNLILDQADADGFVNFGDIARNVLGMQCQYAAYYLDGTAGFPRLADDLRFAGSTKNYHSLIIHAEDASTFVERVLKHRGRC